MTPLIITLDIPDPLLRSECARGLCVQKSDPGPSEPFGSLLMASREPTLVSWSLNTLERSDFAPLVQNLWGLITGGSGRHIGIASACDPNKALENAISSGADTTWSLEEYHAMDEFIRSGKIDDFGKRVFGASEISRIVDSSQVSNIYQSAERI